MMILLNGERTRWNCSHHPFSKRASGMANFIEHLYEENGLEREYIFHTEILLSSLNIQFINLFYNVELEAFPRKKSSPSNGLGLIHKEGLGAWREPH
jgi:hypothetical protein